MDDAPPTQGGLILSHEREAPVGLLAEWLEEHGCPYEVHDVTSAPMPALGEHTFVASLGAEESARASDPPWVAAEIELLRAAIGAGIPVLGLCFGGQALSIALGGSVAPAPKPQVGWFELSERAEGIPAGPWFHWHYEQLTVPPGAQPLAHSEAGPAAFRHGPHLGLQFHPEVTLEVIASWARSEGTLATLGIHPQELRAESERRAPLARRHAWELFGLWWEGLSGAGKGDGRLGTAPS
jgi:GMP synthase-like glutamine amidotransferase